MAQLRLLITCNPPPGEARCHRPEFVFESFFNENLTGFIPLRIIYLKETKSNPGLGMWHCDVKCSPRQHEDRDSDSPSPQKGLGMMDDGTCNPGTDRRHSRRTDEI